MHMFKQKKDDIAIPRMRWSSRRDFLYASIGLIVGLGNSWRFPILLNTMGGGAFLIPYTLVTVFLAIPLTYLELALGQFSEKGQIGIWILCPLGRGVGWAIFTFSTYVCTYYNVLIAYCAYFFFSSFGSELPWSNCKASWALDNCYTRNEESALYSSCVTRKGKEYCSNMSWEMASDHFWKRRVLDVATGDVSGGLGGIKWDLALCLLLMCVLITLVLCMGTHSIEKVAPFTTIYPYVGTAVLLFVTLIHEGSGDGVKYLFYPNFKLLGEFKIWKLATEQVFYSVGIASGSLIVFGSYCPFRSSVHMDAVVLNLVDYGTSLIFGVVLYNCLGAISYDLNMDIDEVAANKTLTFVLIPEALLHLPGPSALWSLVFYSTLICVGLSTEYSLVAANLSVLYDLYPVTMKYKVYMCGLCSSVIFLMGLPFVTRSGSLLLNMVDNFCGGPVLMTVVCAEALVVAWLYGVNKLTDDIHFMLGFRPTTYWQACWLLGPAYLAAIYFLGLYDSDMSFCLSLQVFGWILFAIPVALIVGCGVYYVIKYKRKRHILQVLKPDPDWGPVDPILMKSRRMFSSQAMTKEYMYRQTRLQARNRIRQHIMPETKL